MAIAVPPASSASLAKKSFLFSEVWVYSSYKLIIFWSIGIFGLGVYLQQYTSLVSTYQRPASRRPIKNLNFHFLLIQNELNKVYQ